MINIDTAFRTWISSSSKLKTKARKKAKKAWRGSKFNERILVFDTETTTDYKQKLLYGFYRVYVGDDLREEGLFYAEDISKSDLSIIEHFVEEHSLRLISRECFVDEIFYPEVYLLGAICVGFNLPFDLTRIACAVGAGRGRHKRAFSVQLSRRGRHPRLHIQPASGKAAFIKFAAKKFLAPWEKPFFGGRFLDLSTVAAAFTGAVGITLKKAAQVFKTRDAKSDTADLGTVTLDALAYGRQDVLVTFQLFEKIWEEYLSHPFATDKPEDQHGPNDLPITRIYSPASNAKGYFTSMGASPLFEKQPNIPARLLGIAAAAYYGGRSEVRVRCTDVPVTVVDFTSMYPTDYVLQDLQELTFAQSLDSRDVTEQTRELLSSITQSDVFKPEIWKRLRCFVRIQPKGDILPIRMRNGNEPHSISVTHFESSSPCWFTLSDVIASKLLNGVVPEILEAIEIIASEPEEGLQPVMLRGEITLDPQKPIFKTIVEERQKAKRLAKHDPVAERLDMALKIMANSGAYGIHFEVNVADGAPPSDSRAHSGESFLIENAPNEKPGKFCNPIVASLVTGGARLMLALLESEVTRRGGTYAFCDTDSLAIVTAPANSLSVPSIPFESVQEIIRAFDTLNPYDPEIVPALLKEEMADVRCWAISAKRYALFTVSDSGDIVIEKASESGLGGILGRTPEENTQQLAKAIWQNILEMEILGKAKSEASFDVPLRRKFPLSKPATLRRSSVTSFNRGKTYPNQIKAFNFLQMLTPSLIYGEEIRPIAPFEKSDKKSRKLPWADLFSGNDVCIDWDAQGYSDAVPVVRLSDFIMSYAVHPESKAADSNGNRADASTRGVLCRLWVRERQRTYIGKEIDRLDECEGWSPEPEPMTEIVAAGSQSGTLSAELLQALGSVPRQALALQLGISARRLQDILKGRAQPRNELRNRILEYGLDLKL